MGEELEASNKPCVGQHGAKRAVCGHWSPENSPFRPKTRQKGAQMSRKKSDEIISKKNREKFSGQKMWKKSKNVSVVVKKGQTGTPCLLAL